MLPAWLCDGGPAPALSVQLAAGSWEPAADYIHLRPGRPWTNEGERERREGGRGAEAAPPTQAITEGQVRHYYFRPRQSCRGLRNGWRFACDLHAICILFVKCQNALKMPSPTRPAWKREPWLPPRPTWPGAPIQGPGRECQAGAPGRLKPICEPGRNLAATSLQVCTRLGGQGQEPGPHPRRSPHSRVLGNRGREGLGRPPGRARAWADSWGTGGDGRPPRTGARGPESPAQQPQDSSAVGPTSGGWGVASPAGAGAGGLPPQALWPTGRLIKTSFLPGPAPPAQGDREAAPGEGTGARCRD